MSSCSYVSLYFIIVFLILLQILEQNRFLKVALGYLFLKINVACFEIM